MFPIEARRYMADERGDDIGAGGGVPASPGDDLRADIMAALAQVESGDEDDRDEFDLERADLDDDPPLGDADDKARRGKDSRTGADELTGADDEPKGQRAPASWSESARAAWTALPESVKAQIHQRERDIEAKLRDSAAFNKAIEPAIAAIKQRGGDPVRHIQSLLAWNSAFQANPVKAIDAVSGQFVRDARTARQLIGSLADRFGLEDVLYLVEGAEEERGGRRGRGRADDDEPRGDPRVIELEQRLQAREVQDAIQEWTAVTTEKASDGSLAHPFAKELIDDVRAIVQRAPALSFREAYKLAADNNPDVREKIDQYRDRARAQRLQQTRRDRVGAARARELPVGRSDDAPVPKGSKGDNVRSDILAAMQELGIRSTDF